MGLQFILGIIALLDSGLEGVVDSVEDAPHLIGKHAQCGVNLSTQLLRQLTLTLGAGDILLSELHPRVGDGDAKIWKNTT